MSEIARDIRAVREIDRREKELLFMMAAYWDVEEEDTGSTYARQERLRMLGRLGMIREETE